MLTGIIKQKPLGPPDLGFSKSGSNLRKSA
jgi:hypothetical protein